MITQTFYKTFLRGLIAILTFSIVFGANIALAQNTYVPPAGPPQSFNAPAPIHEGVAGQGKWWQLNLPNYTIGALYGAFEGVVSKWVSADDGVAATKFCLMDPSDVEGGGSATGTSFYTALDYFPSNIQGGIDQGLLNCIDWESGWDTMPVGNNNGELLYWNGYDEVWELSNNIRLFNGNLLGLVDGIIRIGPGSDLTFQQNANCPNESDGSIIRASQIVSPVPGWESLFVGYFRIGCSNGLSLKNLIGDGIEETIVKSIPMLTATDGIDSKLGTFNKAKPRPLCYASENFTAEGTTMVGKGTLVDCEGANHGSLTFYGPKYMAANALEENIVLSEGITGNLTENEFMSYVWPVPFGVSSVTIKACAGGGGGGGGAPGAPGQDGSRGGKPSGGGGGGGGFGRCEVVNANVEDVDSLLIKAGKGGKGGLRGKFGENLAVVDASSGGAGSSTRVYKSNLLGGEGEIIVNVPGGAGGEGGKRLISGASGVIGGAGGRGGSLGLVADMSPQDYQNHNGTSGSQVSGTFTPEFSIFNELGYWTSLTVGNLDGGRGGDGWRDPWFTDFPNFTPYSTQTTSDPETGAGRPGGSGYVSGNASILRGKNGHRGNWGQGGGGGGGTPGNNYGNTCTFPDSDDDNDGDAGFMGEHCNNTGDNSLQGSTNQLKWWLEGGSGGHGGPGFVTITW